MIAAQKGQNAAPLILLVVGLGLLGASLLADVIGLGDDPGFGFQQTMGTVAGVGIAAVALFFVLRR